MIKDITNFHDLTKKYPDRFSKRIHRQVYFSEQLLKRKDIEFAWAGSGKIFLEKRSMTYSVQPPRPTWKEWFALLTRG